MTPPLQSKDKLSVAALSERLETRIVGRCIHVFELVTSTNDVAWELADRGAGEGTVVFAEGQTGGRGRLGRSWWSPRGKGIWMSVLLRPPLGSGAVPMATIIGALATAEAIRDETSLPALIRWPNDILVDGKKASGVLVEARECAGKCELVLGIGIDVNIHRSEVPRDIAGIAVSLSEAAGWPIARIALARRLLAKLDYWYQTNLGGETDAINCRWRELSATLGKHVVLEERGQRFEGTAIDIDVRFGIALRLDTGSIRHFRGEHASLVPDP